METANRLRLAMSTRGLKQSELSNITGINKGALSSYVSGRYQPKQKNLYKLAEALNVSPAWLMGYDVPMDNNPVIDNMIIGVNSRKIDLKDMDTRKALKKYVKEKGNGAFELSLPPLVSGDAAESELQQLLGKTDSVQNFSIDVETDDLAIFDMICRLTGHYTRPKLDDLSGYFVGKLGETSEVFLSNKEFRSFVKRVSATMAAMVDSEIEVAKDDTPPK